MKNSDVLSGQNSRADLGNVAELPEPLIEAFSSKSVINENGERIPLHSNVSHEEALHLYSAVRKLRPSTSIEIGFAQGISATAILQACEHNGGGTHHVVDPFQSNFEDAGLAMASRAKLDHRLIFHRKFAEEVVPQLPTLQFGFIDASHLFDLSLLEFVLIDKKLEVGGIVAFHDMWMPSLQKLFRYILSNRAYEVAWKFLPGTRSTRHNARSVIARLLRVLPGSNRLFRPELLGPWSALGIPNLVFLRKTADDQRDWRFHSSF